MTERLADLSGRIAGIRQLRSVVNAMRGIAAARARQARADLAAVESLAASIARAIGRTLPLLPADGARDGSGRRGLVLFGAEQGFAGAFTDRVLEAAETGGALLLLIGTRARSVAAERGIVPDWWHAMPAHPPGIPRLADSIVEALSPHLAAGRIARLDAVFGDWHAAHGTQAVRRQLLPLDPAAIPQAKGPPPLMNLQPAALLAELTQAYLHAQLCDAALHAFAAENEARMAAMAAAGGQIDRRLEGLEARLRIVRQEEITAEIVELAAGETAARG